ncbi:MAG TPA: signal peptidase I [Candidatus Sulfotelmatobacter sp.]|jgi:signal peptidase I|nr:signal peptidase I [Candidatus Sulfotelmatobacter sp.]
MTLLRWFISQTVRNACAAHKHYRRLLAAHADLLKPDAVTAVQGKLDALDDAIRAGNTEQMKTTGDELLAAAEKNIPAYPSASLRENVEVLLVALAVAMGIRTFFLQPFKIPTGSMQPTLFGVNSENLLGDTNFKMPTGWQHVKEWFGGISYVHVVAQADGPLRVDKPFQILIFNIWQNLWIGDTKQTIWFPPDMGEGQYDRLNNYIEPLIIRGRLHIGDGYVYHKGEEVVNLRVSAGDHLFVDRMSYNFRKPARGDTIVFETEGIPEEQRSKWNIPADQFYIKRLVGLPGERVSIGDDRHLRINGVRLDASTPHFENVYGFDPDKPPRESHWSGHLNYTEAQTYQLSNMGYLPFFPDEETVYQVPPDSCLPMGDNTCNSLDSRYWGAIPEKYVIGRSFFVYWPLTDRFGWGTR